MAIRTTEDAVRGIIPHDPKVSMTPFIAIANELVDWLVACPGVAFTAAKLELIERWLAAHAYAIFDPQETEKKTGDASAKFQVGILGKGLKSTQWGNMALTLDTSGCLTKLGQPKAGLQWLGREVEDQKNNATNLSQ